LPEIRQIVGVLFVKVTAKPEEAEKFKLWLASVVRILLGALKVIVWLRREIIENEAVVLALL